jgi:hypothetical protein
MTKVFDDYHCRPHPIKPDVSIQPPCGGGGDNGQFARIWI